MALVHKATVEKINLIAFIFCWAVMQKYFDMSA